MGRRISIKLNGRQDKSIIMVCILCMAMLFSFYGCGDKPSAPPVKAAKKQGAKNIVSPAAAPQAEAVIAEAPEQAGYIYQQRERRDPFTPLIVPQKQIIKREGARDGTLGGYDISEFTLVAIANKGGEFFALLTTPDNRSFTVTKGMTIGLSKGKVKDISRDKVVLVEYSVNYRGELKPREIILEFHKGEVE